jgi:Zn finger protein HypA/HybF involved in hydrogenase expression
LGGYETIFIFDSDPVCYQCLEKNDSRLLREYARAIYDGEMTCHIESASEIDPGDVYCEECGRDLSAYTEEDACPDCFMKRPDCTYCLTGHSDVVFGG